MDLQITARTTDKVTLHTLILIAMQKQSVSGQLTIIKYANLPSVRCTSKNVT